MKAIMERISIRWASALLVGAAAALAACNRVPDVVKIGVGAPLTGPLAPEGQDLLHGVELAAAEINADGGMRISGKRVKVEIVSADDKANPVDGDVAARRLVDAGVVAAIAHLNSGVSIPMAAIYAEAGIPQLAISTKTEYTRQGLPTTLRLIANDDLQSKAIGSYALQMNGVGRIAVVDDSTPYGKGLADQAVAVITAAKREIGVRRSLNDKTTDFVDLAAALEDDKTDLLITTLSAFQVEALIKRLTRNGPSSIKILGGDALKTSALAEVGRRVGGIFATSPVLEAREFPNGNRFLARFRQRFGSDPVYGAHYTYDATHLIADALGRNASVDKKSLLAQLKKFDGNAPVTGTMRFDESGEQRFGSVGVYKLEPQGRWGLIYQADRW